VVKPLQKVMVIIVINIINKPQKKEITKKSEVDKNGKKSK